MLTLPSRTDHRLISATDPRLSHFLHGAACSRLRIRENGYNRDGVFSRRGDIDDVLSKMRKAN